MDRSDVFLSYRRANVDFVKKLDQALKATGREVWVDWEDIPPGVAGFTDEITRGIEGANAFIAVLSPEYLQSEYCLMELEYAVKLNKRLVPIVYSKFDGNAPSGIGHINWVYFCPHAGQENTFDVSFPKVIEALEADVEYIRDHTRLLIRAKEWETHQREASFLLDGAEIEKAEHWFTRGTAIKPSPLEIHADYVFSSRAFERMRQQRQRVFLAIGMAITLLLAIFAGFQTIQANRESERARTAEIRAYQNELAAHNLALQSSSDLVFYRDDNTDLAIALGIEANKAQDAPPSAQRVLYDAATAPGTRRVFAGHDGSVRAMAVSVDETWAISSGNDTTLMVWDLQTGEMIRQMGVPSNINPKVGHIKEVWDVELLPDNQHVLSTGADNRVLLWNVQTGEIVREYTVFLFPPDPAITTLTPTPTATLTPTLTPTSQATDTGTNADASATPTTTPVPPAPPPMIHIKVIDDLAISPDGKTFVTASEDTTLILWDMETGEALLRFGLPNNRDELIGHVNATYTVDFSPTGTRIVSGSSDRTLIMWDTNTGQRLRRYGKTNNTDVNQGHIRQVYNIVFNADGTKFLSGGADKMVLLWDAATGKVLQVFEGHTASTYGLAISKDDKQVITSSQDESILMWDARTGRQLQRFTGHKATIASIQYLSDARQLLSLSHDGTLRLWDLYRVTEQQRFASVDSETTVQNYRVEYNADASRVVVASSDNVARLYDTETGEIIRVFGVPANTDAAVGHTTTVIGAVFSPDGRTVATTSYDTTAILWDVETGELLHRFGVVDNKDTAVGHINYAWGVEFTPDGKYLATGSFDSTIILWNIETGEITQQFGQPKNKDAAVGHTNGVLSMVFNPDATQMLSIAWDKTMILWDVQTGKPIRTFIGHDDWVWDVAATRDWKMAITASADSVLILWDIQTGKEIRRFYGHQDGALSVAFSPDETMAVSGGRDNALILWDIASGAEIRHIRGHANWVRGVAFHPTDDKVLSTGSEGLVRVWHIDTLDELIAWTEANRYIYTFTCVDRRQYQVKPLCDESEYGQ